MIILHAFSDGWETCPCSAGTRASKPIGSSPSSTLPPPSPPKHSTRSSDLQTVHHISFRLVSSFHSVRLPFFSLLAVLAKVSFSFPSPRKTYAMEPSSLLLSTRMLQRKRPVDMKIRQKGEKGTGQVGKELFGTTSERRRDAKVQYGWKGRARKAQKKSFFWVEKRGSTGNARTVRERKKKRGKSLL